jgi:hypothetical protein
MLVKANRPAVQCSLTRPGALCYVYVMSIKRITISVPDEVAIRIKKAAGSTPVSAWVTGIVEERLEDRELDRLWKEFYQAVRPQPKDVRRADAIFNRLTKSRRKTA